MDPRPASTTAVLVAGYRARATARGDALCHDPWAARLAGSEGEHLSRDFDAVQPHMELWIGLRTAHLDARVLAHTRRGPARQVVILGSGLDTRAARLAHAGVRFFEVDQAASLADRRRRIAALADYPAEAATQVACDFERDDFLERLLAAGFDAEAPAVIVWEGVSYYLGEPAVRATLGRIATGCHPRTAVLFDLVGKKMAEGSARHADDLATRDHVARFGEPIRWGTNDVLPLLFELGYRRVSVRTFDEVGLNRTGTYDRERKWRFQFLAEASRDDLGESA